MYWRSSLGVITLLGLLSFFSFLKLVVLFLFIIIVQWKKIKEIYYYLFWKWLLIIMIVIIKDILYIHYMITTWCYFNYMCVYVPRRETQKNKKNTKYQWKTYYNQHLRMLKTNKNIQYNNSLPKLPMAINKIQVFTKDLDFVFGLCNLYLYQDPPMPTLTSITGSIPLLILPKIIILFRLLPSTSSINNIWHYNVYGCQLENFHSEFCSLAIWDSLVVWSTWTTIQAIL